MQNFTKKRIALAVGAALTAVSGGAYAAAATVAVRSAGAVLVNKGTLAESDKQSLFSATGMATDKLKLKLYVKSDSTSPILFGESTAANSVPVIGRDTTMSADTANHILVYATNGTTTVDLANRIDSGTTVVPSQVSASGLYTLSADIQTGLLAAGEKFRVDSASGKVLFTNDSGTTWLNVKVRMPSTKTGATLDSKGFFSNDTGAVDATYNATTDSTNLLATFDSTDVVAGHTLLPLPTFKTASDSTGLINGVTMETYGTALGTVAAANLRLFPVFPATGGDTTTTTWNDSGASTTDITPTVTTSGSKVTISFTGATANWTTGDSVADAAAYGSAGFNTGISGTKLPLRINLVSGQAVAYGTAVAESTGSTAYLMKSASDTTATVGLTIDSTSSSIADGAAPVVLSTNYSSTTKTLKILFSEPIVGIKAATGDTTQDVAEANEYVAYGTSFPGVTLASANFNTDGKLNESQSGAASSGGVGTLTLSNVPTTFLNQKLLVAKRISMAEPGEVGYSLNDTTTSQMDPTSGYKTVNNEVLSASGTITITAAANTLNFDDETAARAYMKSGSATDVERIEVTYAHKLAWDTTAIIKDHFKLKAIDSTNVVPENFSAFLDSTNVTIDATTGILKVALPNNLIVKNLKGFVLEYDTQWGDGKGVLQFTDPADSVKKVVTGQTVNGGATKAIDSNEISLPYYITAAQAPLYTMETDATYTNVSADSKVTTYLAKWLDAFRGGAYDTNDSGGSSSHTFGGGRITDPGNKKITDLELELGDTTAYTALAVELNKAKPGKIKAYVQIASSNDQVKGGQNTGSKDTTSSQAENWLEAHAYFAIDPTKLGKTSSLGGELDPVYQVELDVGTGAISGRLTGNITTTLQRVTGKYRGLTFVKSDGTLDSQASNAVSTASVIGTGGKVTQMIGVDAKPTDAPNLQGTFLLSVLEESGKVPRLITSADPGAGNFVPFSSNLLTGTSGRTKIALDANLVKTNVLADSSMAWQLVGVGAIDRTPKTGTVQQAVGGVAFPRMFVSLDSGAASVYPTSLWAGTGDTATADLALTMQGSKAGIASEGASGDTISNIGGPTVNPQQFAFAFMNDSKQSNRSLYTLTRTAAKTSIPAGWALIAAPATMPAANWCATATSLNCVSHMLKVGAGYATPATWVVGDTGTPTLTAGEPVFVFVKGALSLN